MGIRGLVVPGRFLGVTPGASGIGGVLDATAIRAPGRFRLFLVIHLNAAEGTRLGKSLCKIIGFYPVFASKDDHALAGKEALHSGCIYVETVHEPALDFALAFTFPDFSFKQDHIELFQRCSSH